MFHKYTFRVSVLAAALSGAMMLLPAGAQDHSIKLDVIARDSADNPVTGLKQQDFVVLDNGSSKAISTFAEVSKDDTPPTIVLVLDLINSPFTSTTFQRQQLTKFLQANGGHLKYPTVLIVAAPDSVMSSNTPTTDGNVLAAKLAKVKLGPVVVQHTGGAAAAAQRIDISQKVLNNILASTQRFDGRKLVFWMSPGWPLMGGETLSPGTEEKILSLVMNYSTGMREIRVTLYALNAEGPDASVDDLQAYERYLKGVNEPNKTDLADVSLQVLATQSGGLVLYSNDLVAMIDRCLKDADAYYEIEFSASDPEKNILFHDVRVKVNRPNTVIRTRNGYYARQIVHLQGAKR